MALFKTPEYTLIGSKALEEAKPYLKKCGKKALIVAGTCRQGNCSIQRKRM